MYELVVVAGLFLAGREGEGDAARVFHKMDFGSLEACQRAEDRFGEGLEQSLRRMMRRHWLDRLPDNADWRIETGSACSEKPSGGVR